MLIINTSMLTYYTLLKCYQFLLQIEVFGTQNEMTDRDTLSPFN